MHIFAINGRTGTLRMVKHLFFATSSPSVANFYLRKTVHLHEGKFDKVLIATVNRNMYVDDMMKSTSTETALGLKWNIKEDKFLQEVLEKILKQVNQKPVTR